MTTTSYLDALAEFASCMRFDDLPLPVVESAVAVVTDCVGVIAAGSREEEMRRLRSIEPEGGGADGLCTVIGARATASARNAAFLNGAAGTFLELDEGNRYCRGHPGVHVVPTALAVAEAGRLDGAAFLTAVAVGYDVAARIGAACRLHPSVHPHGTWGTVGAAVAVGWLRGADPDRMRRLINIAAGLNLAASFASLEQGATIRNSFAGVSAINGLLTHDLASAGFTGEADALATIYGGILGSELDVGVLVDQLGSRFEITRNYFKRHACCRYNHSALDALLDGCAPQFGGAIDPARVRSILVETYSYAASLVNRSPDTMLAAKYSLPFAMATALATGATGAEGFSEAALRCEAVRDLALRVVVREEPSMTARMPAERAARVTVTTTDGRVVTAAVSNSRGDYDNPYSDDELAEKFDELAEPSWGPATRDLRRLLTDMRGLRDMSAVGEALREAAAL